MMSLMTRMPGKRTRDQLAQLIFDSSDDDSDSSTSRDSATDSAEETDADSEGVFCKCGEPNTQHMIGCDGPTCRYEWLHFKCVGIDPKNIPKGKWLCEDCQSQTKKEEQHRVPSGQFVLPVSNLQNENSVKEEEQHRVPSGQFVLPVSNLQNQNSVKEEEQHRVPSGQFVLPVSNLQNENSVKETKKQTPRDIYILPKPNNDKNTQAMYIDAVMKESLSVAQKQHASNLRQACHAVIHEGASLGDAAAQFSVGRYVLGDYVKDQLKANLSDACHDVINKKYSVKRAAKAYGVVRGLLEERVKAEKDASQRAGGLKTSSHPVTSTFEQNLHQACMDVMSSRCTLSEAGRIYKMHTTTIKSKLRTVLVLTTAEENDLVKMCIKMAVLGYSDRIKSNVISRIKALLDNEGKQGIKRVHTFPDNTPDNFWWESFRKRHPEFESIPYDESSQVASDITLIPSSGQASQNEALTNVGQELEPKPSPSTTDQVYYILPTPRESQEKFILVKQSSQPESQVHPVTESAVEADSPHQPNQSHPPEPLEMSSNPVQDDQTSESSQSSNVLHHLSLEDSESPATQPSKGGDAVEGKDSSWIAEAKGVSGGTEVPSLSSGETEQSSLVYGETEVIPPSVDATGDKVEQTHVAPTNEAAWPHLVIGDRDIPQIKVVVCPTETAKAGQTDEDEASKADAIVEGDQAGQSNQLAVNCVVQPSVTANPGTATPVTLKPTMNEVPRLTMGTNSVRQNILVTGSTEKPVALDSVQSNRVVADGNILSTPATNKVEPLYYRRVIAPKTGPTEKPVAVDSVHGNILSTPATNNVAPLFRRAIAPKTPPLFVVDGRIVEPGQVYMAKNSLQPNAAVGSKQALQKKYVVTFNKVANQKSVSSVNTGLLTGIGTAAQPCLVSSASPCASLTQASVGKRLIKQGTLSGKYVQASVSSAGDETVATSAPPLPVSGHFPKHSQDPVENSSSNRSPDSTGVFVAKHTIDKTLPDALSCLENSLTKEQRESFAFRLQIGDDRRDDLLYNAWKALKRLYHHTDIYNMYNKVAVLTDLVPETFDVPIASKLLESPLMDPCDHDCNGQVRGRARSEKGSSILAELRRGRKRRKITSKLAQTETPGTSRKSAKRFLEPWKYEMKKPNKRKSRISRYADDDFFSIVPEDKGSSEETTQSHIPTKIETPETFGT